MEGNENLVNDIYMEFLECVTNQLLYIRDIYPKGKQICLYYDHSFKNTLAEIFERRLKFGVYFWYSRHPQITSYITSALDQIRILLKAGLLKS